MNVKHIDALWPASPDTAEPVSLYSGESGVLSWVSTDAESVYLENQKAGKALPYGPQDIEYRFNKNGFRCEEFSEIKNRQKVLSVGCSNTCGIGLPEQHTWPYQVTQEIAHQTLWSNTVNLNLGLAGSSNRSIAIRAIRAMELFEPKYAFVAWTYPSRIQFVYEDGEVADWWAPDKKDEASLDPKVLMKLDYFTQVQSDMNDLNNLIYDIKNVEMAARCYNVRLCNSFIYLDKPAQDWLRPRVFGLFDHSKPTWSADRARDLLHPGPDYNRWLAEKMIEWYLKRMV